VALERNILDRIRREFKARGIWLLKVHGSPLQQRGVPDLIGCWRGRFIALEGKVPGEQPTPIQAYRLEEIRRAGGIAECVHSLAEALGVLEGNEMCALKPFMAFEVTPERLTKAEAAIAAAKPRLSQSQAMEVAFELGFGDAIDMNEETGQIDIDLTNLQMIAFAAALAAVAETGGRMTDRDA
jgi:hypothetical protein